MAQQIIDLGTVDNDGTGDSLKAGGAKANANFAELYASDALKAPLASPAFTGTPSGPTAAPGTNTTQLATTAFVTTVVTGLLKLKGDTDASANPNYPAAVKGDSYVVTVAGKIGGASGVSVDIGDVYVARADNAGGTQAAVGASWFVLEHNLAGALLAANNLSDLANAATARTNLGLAIGTNVQAYSAALALYAAISPSANVQSFLGAANYAAMRTLLGITPVDVQIFTANGTWTKPAGAVSVRAMLIGGGGGGGGGAVVAASTAASGGGAGGGSAVSDRSWAASDLSASETITIGAGGTSGAGGSSAGGSGSAGGAGGTTSFGSKQRAFGGGGGAGGASGANAGGGGSGGLTGPGGTGTTAAGTGGGLNGVAGNSQSNTAGGSGGGGSTSGGAAAGGGTALAGGGGGGAGGTLTAANVTIAGGTGGLAMPSTAAAGGAAGTNPGGAGGVVTTALPHNGGGSGGGGGGSATVAVGGAGAAGQAGGGGAGGGGATQVGFAGGAGGVGGDGRVVVISYF